ncbi:MAG: DUF4190 domain-containing protein [Bifidobacterium sp.]|uniref:DUF4190 domain-containing protein n=2 Tax=Bifidobacterium TaxID=1678 RepID=A0AB39UER5_9BIFI
MSSSERNPGQVGPSGNYGVPQPNAPMQQQPDNGGNRPIENPQKQNVQDQNSQDQNVQNQNVLRKPQSSPKPEYGAMASQYPGWNPYVFGAPEPEQKAEAKPAPAQSRQNQGLWAGNPYLRPGNGGSNGAPGNGAPNNANQGGNGMNGDPRQGGAPNPQSTQFGNDRNLNRRGMYPTIDPNDPNQNPLYGRWDPYAILSFILALFFPFPFMPAIMGAISVYRTRFFHMRGKGLAIAAIVINLAYSALVIWMWINHIDASQLYQDIYSWIGSTTGTSGSSVSA